ncbi:MAG: LysR family transcriptional regulator [Clostridiales bacterium]|nr:LysR family transcriptional regulator [Clostridiales bacterium]
MELKQLRYFYRVYQDRSMQRAAKHLIVSQQAVSQLIRNLENELGVPMFIRSNTGLEPTEFADFLAEEAKRILLRLDTVVYTIQKKGRSIGGSVNIVFLLGHIGAGSRLSTKALLDFKKIYPEIHTTWRCATPDECEKMVLEDEADFALTVFPDNSEMFHCVKLYEFEWCLLMRHGHPLSSRKSIAMEDLAGEKLLMPKGEQHDRQQIMRVLPSDNQPVFLDPPNSLFDMVYQNILDDDALMICAVPHATLFNPSLVAIVPFQTNLLRNQIYILSKKEGFLSSAAMQAKDFLLTEWGFCVK